MGATLMGATLMGATLMGATLMEDASTAVALANNVARDTPLSHRHNFSFI